MCTYLESSFISTGLISAFLSIPRLESDFTPQQQLREMALEEMECLMMLVHHTAVSDLKYLV